MTDTSIFTESGYRTSRLPDNSLIIHDVEIFCETSRGGTDFDLDWIRTAHRYAMQQQADGYLPPLHTKHHKHGEQFEGKFAGKFKIHNTLKAISYKGKSCMAIVADLHVTDPEVEAALMQGAFPYRSVEILDVGVPKIDGLALLDHDSPYLELPMLMIGGVSPETLFQGYNVEACNRDMEMLVCFSKESKKAHVLFNSGPSNVAVIEKPDTKEIAELDAHIESMEKNGFSQDEIAKAVVDIYELFDGVIPGFEGK